MPAVRDEISRVVCLATPECPRYSEASILPFEDGRLFLAYTEFHGGDWRDGGPARLMARWSHDEGARWSEPFLLQDNIGRRNVMQASLLRLPSGRVLLAFLRKDAEPAPGARGELQVLLKHSDDACRTWSEPRAVTQGEGYWCGTNDRLIRLRSGRLLLPVGERSLGCHAWLSDDDGATWRRGCGTLPAPAGTTQWDEPVAVELTDGTVALFIRNELHFLHIAHSRDGGETWMLHETQGPSVGTTPCMVRRLPESPELLLIWNNHHRRTNLTAALSADDGAHWTNFRILEEEEEWPLVRSHTYPSLAFLRGNAHLTYWETHPHPAAGRLFHLVYRRLPLDWFRVRPARRPAVYDPERGLLSGSAEYDGQAT